MIPNERAEPFSDLHIDQRRRERSAAFQWRSRLLPAVESAYRVDAVSRSKAVGLWQFLASSGQDYGLEQDWWYDGRRDVIASTEAALDYLTVLHARFDNDWFLALAAYNGGQGNLARSIRSNQSRALKTNYLALDLRSRDASLRAKANCTAQHSARPGQITALPYPKSQTNHPLLR